MHIEIYPQNSRKFTLGIFQINLYSRKFWKIYPRNSSPKPKNRRITELEARNAFISNRLETYDSQIAGEQTRVQEIIDMVSVFFCFCVAMTHAYDSWKWLICDNDLYMMTSIRLSLDLWFTNVQLGSLADNNFSIVKLDWWIITFKNDVIMTSSSEAFLKSNAFLEMTLILHFYDPNILNLVF